MKRYIYPVYSDTIHLDCLLLLYAAIFVITFFFSGNLSHDLLLWAGLAALTLNVLRFFSIVVIDKTGISVHRLLRSVRVGRK